MWHELIITDVTHMDADRVCIAGVDHKGNNIRPVRPYPYAVCETDLKVQEKIVRPRAVLEMFLDVPNDRYPPHLEDYLWLIPNKTKYLRLVDESVWKKVLGRTTKTSVGEIFGTEINNNRSIKPGTGTGSLGTIKPKSIKEFTYKIVVRDGQEKRDHRLTFRDHADKFYPNIVVKDLSLCSYADYLHVYEGLSAEEISLFITEKIKRKQIWLRIGLTREWNGWCYLQVTGVYTFPDYLNGQCFADFSL